MHQQQGLLYEIHKQISSEPGHDIFDEWKLGTVQAHLDFQAIECWISGKSSKTWRYSRRRWKRIVKLDDS
jgi:hypothetical protein